MADVIAGHEGGLYINDVIFTCDRWKVRVEHTRIPKNDYSSRKKKVKPGMYETQVECSGYWDRDTNMHTVHGLTPGAEITGIKGYLIKGGLVFAFTTIVLVTMEIASEVDGRMDSSWTGIVNGTWSGPGGWSLTA
jgi:hypothetical protein